MKKTKQEQADELRTKIEAAIENGEFVLDHGLGYLQDIQVANNSRIGCGGCALGAAAYVLSGRTVTYAYGEDCQRLSQAGGLSAVDVSQLEMGFESWWSVRVGKVRYSRDENHPFYQLGKDLRERFST